MVTPSSIHDLIKALMDMETPFPARLLYQFSDMPADDLQVLATAWLSIPVMRRRAVLQDLLELSEHDDLLMFENIGRIALEDGDAECEVSGISLLLEAEDPKLIPIFLQMLSAADEAEFVRAAAANALGFYIYLGELEEIKTDLLHKIEDALLLAYAKDPSDLVRRRALESLGFSGREEVPPLLRFASAKDSEEWLESALFAMGRSADQQWESLVLEHLDHDNPDVKGQAIHAAGELYLTSARVRLLKQVDREKDEYLRSEMIWALSQIGGEGIEEKFERLLATTDDDEEASLLEEALDMLNFTNEAANLDLMKIDFDHVHDSLDEDEDEIEPWDTDEDEDDEYEDLEDLDDEEWQRYVDDDGEDLDGSLEDSYMLEDPDDDEDDL
ncbi:MAG TPA: HEAT repeat domain-containing protein [Anaerolineaceae bacterium]|nr:HEAT repeat domain-containing protein [Anaerolineaceae bacterium]